MPGDDQGDDLIGKNGLASTWPRMRYGALEDLLVELTGGDPRSVVGRFKKLRLMPFPDGIRLGTGNRVEYDLPRVIALCTAFEINALLVPQSNAVGIVRSVWPEIVRGIVAGAVELGILPKPASMPTGLSAIVAILPDGFASESHVQASAANLPAETRHASELGMVAELRLDCGRLVELVELRIKSASGDATGASAAFGDLDLSFGWGAGQVPHRASVSNLFSGSSFLDRGPYLERAAAFLNLAANLPKEDDDTPPSGLRARRGAQNLLDYLSRPSPIDAWKGEIGTSDGRPRLKHFLAAVGDKAGLTSSTRWPATMLATTGASPSTRAKALIGKALRFEAEKRASGKGAVAP